ncbi:MAG: GNAT family N-acetyltransferase [Clostridiales bacterium]|nr:GNAT family N-acetyltransferase [Clostridiales bacterium]
MLFEYNDNAEPVFVSGNYTLKTIGISETRKMKGKIISAFSWDNAEDFLLKGKGYCIVINDNIAAWAFSAAISEREIDIGG